MPRLGVSDSSSSYYVLDNNFKLYFLNSTYARAQSGAPRCKPSANTVRKLVEPFQINSMAISSRSKRNTSRPRETRTRWKGTFIMWAHKLSSGDILAINSYRRWVIKKRTCGHLQRLGRAVGGRWCDSAGGAWKWEARAPWGAGVTWYHPRDTHRGDHWLPRACGGNFLSFPQTFGQVRSRQQELTLESSCFKGITLVSHLVSLLQPMGSSEVTVEDELLYSSPEENLNFRGWNFNDLEWFSKRFSSKIFEPMPF